MSQETTKAAPRRAAMELFQRAFTGAGLDIGAGPDPLHAGLGFPGIVRCEVFDREQGDAERIDEYLPPESFDFVHASQCLEHMADPHDAFRRWLSLVKPGGWLVFSVPDWELYEGCRWPSRHNPDHKSAWGIGPMRQSRINFQPPYFDILEFLKFLAPQALPMLLQIADTRYDYMLFGSDRDQTLSDNAEAFIEVVLWKRHHFFPQ